MMSFSPSQLAEFFGSSMRAHKPASVARGELIASRRLNEDPRIINRHTDRAAALSGTTVGAMTSDDLAIALRKHGFQHRPGATPKAACTNET